MSGEQVYKIGRSRIERSREHMVVEQEHKVVGTDENRNGPSGITGARDEIHNITLRSGFNSNEARIRPRR